MTTERRYNAVKLAGVILSAAIAFGAVMLRLGQSEFMPRAEAKENMINIEQRLDTRLERIEDKVDRLLLGECR